MIKITRLHLLLLGIIAVIAGFYFYQVQQENRRLREFAAIESEREHERQRIEEEKQRQNELIKIEKLAREAVAVAGEYHIIARKECKDVSTGEAILRQAKENLAQKNFNDALDLARKSIAEFQSAPHAALYYEVRGGDSLWKIAKMPRHYGRGSLWVKIWRANEKKIPDFDLIYARMMLLIPQL